MQPFVAAVLEDYVRIENPPSRLAGEFPTLTLGQDGREAQLHYSGQEELAALLTHFQSLAIPFVAGGAGWHPAAVFEQLRDQHLVTGTIKTIVWSGLGQVELGEA